MSHTAVKVLRLILAFVFITVLLSGCSSKKSCSVDSQCKEGYFCGSNSKCTEFSLGDYNIAFENLTDGQLLTTADDIDRSKEGIQIDIPVKFENTKKVLKDGMSVILSVTGKGTTPSVYSGSIVKNKILFSQVTIPVGEVVVRSYLAQNPDKEAKVTLNVKNIGVEVYYLKNGDGVKTVLEKAVVTDDDDFDKITANGIQLSLSASTEGLATGDLVKIYIPELQEDAVSEAVVDETGNVDFNSVNIPVWASVRMSIVSGKYSRSIYFSVISEVHCGFIVNLENDKTFGISDDENTGLAGLQYDLIISEITGCGKGSKVSVYIDKQPGTGVLPDNSLFTASDTVEQRITLPKSKTANDKRQVIITIEDNKKNLDGSASFAGILVDLDPPLGEISFPEVGQILNMNDDVDTAIPGLQIEFTGEADDALTSPVRVTLKLGDAVISENAEVKGDFTVPQTFLNSAQTLDLTALIVDGAGNETNILVPFSVNIDTEITFESVCKKTGAAIIDAMWLNALDDADDTEDKLQCEIIVRLSEGSAGNFASLTVGAGTEIKKAVESDGTASFDVELDESEGGIVLGAKAFVDDALAGQSNLTVRVDTTPPTVQVGNNLLLNNGETTSASNITFDFVCSESSCDFNSLLDSEVSDIFTADTSRILTGLAGGLHSIKVKALDVAGNEGVQTVFNWTIDNINPETTITTNPGAGSVNHDALFEFTSSKSGSKFSCRLEKDGADYLPNDGTWEACNTGSRYYSGLGDGEYRFFVRAEDASGNIDPSPAEHFWVIGTAAPVTTITEVIPSDPVTKLTTIQFKYEATVESTYSCKLQKNGSVESDWSDCSSKTKTYTTLGDGNYTFEVKATAVYGVEENTPVAYGWTVDTVLPKVKILSKPSLSSPFDSGAFTFECDGEIDPCSFACTLDGSVVDCSSGSYSYSALSGGNHRFIIVATDVAGNNSLAVTDPANEFLNDYTWEVDPAVLGVQITSHPDAISSSSSAAFEFTSNKIAAFECKLDTGSFGACTSPKNYSGLSDGTHTFVVKATFGSDSVEDSYTWTVDTTDPVISITNAPDNPTFQTGATFVFSANESVTFECKRSTSSTWTSCTSPKIYSAGTFGVAGTEQTYTFEIRATDTAGNIGTASHTWLVDLAGPAIEWLTPPPTTEGKVIVSKADDVYQSDPNLYAINIKVKVSGSNIGKPINVTGFKTPPGYTVVNVTSDSPQEYTLVVGLQDGARINNPLTISVEDNSSNIATISKIVIVNTVEPAISWASPVDGYKFVSGTPVPAFVFNVWNAEPGSVVDLIDSDTGLSVGSKATVGTTGDTFEHVTITPTLSDRCTPYKFYATFYDAAGATRYYTNSTTDFYLKTARNFTVDKTKIVIGTVDVTGVNGIDRILNRADNLNSDPDGEMQTDVSVQVSDSGNPSDDQKIVKVFTDNGSGAGTSILISTLNGISNEADFIKLPLGEYSQIIKIQATDCSGNVTSKTLASITVDTIAPDLTLVSPKGSSTNWRWITDADDPTLGTVNGSGQFTGIKMKINSSESLGSFKEVIHTAYNYSGTQLYENNITSSATVGTMVLNVNLPDLEYAKHRFEATVEDLAGNRKTIGNGTNDLYEVDAIVPGIVFTNISEGASFGTDMDGSSPGFQIVFQMNVTNVEPSSIYTIVAIPVLSQGGGIDSSRFTKTWSGRVTADGAASRSSTFGKGWWRISASIKDDHSNQSVTPVSGGYDINITANIATVDVLKSIGYDQGAGPILNGTTVEIPSWFNSEDIDCSGDSCDTEIEVWTDAPSNSTVYVSLNGGSEVSDTTSAAGLKSFADFSLTLDAALDYNTLTVRIVSSTMDESIETYYIKVDRTPPVLTLASPVNCSGDPVCRRIDLIDNISTSVVELAELGYGYADDSITGGSLNFKPASVIQFDITGANAGTVEVESISGVANGTSDIMFDSIAGTYFASFENMTVEDTNLSGQKDYNLIFKVTEHPSGSTVRYLIKLHIELIKPSAINISDKVLTYKKEGKAKIEWVAIQGNNSAFGENPGAMYEYDVRYQDYSEGVCSISSNFETAKKPLETVAGPAPAPMVGDMSYTFYLNRINNGKAVSDPLFRESDTHFNGDSYCFAVRAIDAVYAEDGTILAKNKGSIAQEDIGKIEVEWSEIRGVSPQTHFNVIRNLGDLDGDAFEDYVIADPYRTSDGTNNDLAGNIKIYFSNGLMAFEKTGEPGERLGNGISSRADFNKDGFLDFAYTNAYGEIYIHYGSSEGLSEMSALPFVAKDNSTQGLRSMATGDYNGDGCDDIAVSAPTVNGSGSARGEVYIYFGRGGTGCPAFPYDGDSPDVTFEGGTDNDQLGRIEISSVGDINDDGMIDFVFGASSKIYVAYGGDSGGTISSYTITGLKTLAQTRIGYGDFNGDNYSDLVVGDNDKVMIYYGKDSGITTPASVIISDMSVLNYTYPPAVTNFARAVSPYSPDVNGDGLSDLVAASDRGLLVYYTFNDELLKTPSIFDPFVDTTSTLLKVLMLENKIVYCDNRADFGSCYTYNYGE